jgi:hypothetical protein
MPYIKSKGAKTTSWGPGAAGMRLLNHRPGSPAARMPTVSAVHAPCLQCSACAEQRLAAPTQQVETPNQTTALAHKHHPHNRVANFTLAAGKLIHTAAAIQA